jgi:hypothetical protein
VECVFALTIVEWGIASFTARFNSQNTGRIAGAFPALLFMIAPQADAAT